jgi:hypothetical protein
MFNFRYYPAQKLRMKRNAEGNTLKKIEPTRRDSTLDGMIHCGAQSASVSILVSTRDSRSET